MINREITYERDVSKSYMKTPAVIESCLDEKLIFRKEYKGILAMEKCYVNGKGQYWFNITGKQALDAYCRINTIDQKFFENLILRICSQLEVLEWNLIDTNCLIVDPEMIFLNHTGEDISFILYPDTRDNFHHELQQLMEYLLTKLNHNDKAGVQQAYEIYEMTLSEGYSIQDLKNTILEKREENKNTDIKRTMDTTWSNTEEYLTVKKDDVNKEKIETEDIMEGTGIFCNPKIFLEIEEKILALWEKAKEILLNSQKKEDEIPMVVHPEDNEEEEMEITIHPTICLATEFGESRGVLVHEGIGAYPDFELKEEMGMVGKNPKARLQINKETISQFHAKIEYINHTYYIEDLNSTNGTFVNDEMLNYKEKRVLTSGDILRFADVRYRFL